MFRAFRGGLEERLANRVIRSMTTTVGMKFRDFVVLGADKRATSGYYVAHKKVRKVIKITDYMALTVSGLVADAQVLAEWLSNYAELYSINMKRRMPVKVAAQYLSTILYSAKFFPYIVQLLLGGYDEEPHIFNLDWFGTVTEEKYAATGSGSPIAIGVIEDGYREDMSVDEAVDLARRAISSSISRDAFTGNGIDIVVIGRNYIKEYSFPLSKVHVKEQ